MTNKKLPTMAQIEKLNTRVKAGEFKSIANDLPHIVRCWVSGWDFYPPVPQNQNQTHFRADYSSNFDKFLLRCIEMINWANTEWYWHNQQAKVNK